ncbi:MAG: AAA family ATPase [Candidatus Omnitrophota bacterium]
MPDKIIADRYQIKQPLAEDNLSQSYLAYDSKTWSMVDLRLFREEIRKKPPEILFRFRKDVRELAGIENEHILNIIDAGEFEGRDYVATARLDAIRLSEYLSRPIDIEDAIEIILQISTGLSLLHQKGIIHRTLKPSSVIILKKDGRITAKITDCGTGLLLDLVSIKTPQDIIQFFGYMSPEATGILRKPIDERSDIYSLGIIFYQLLTGRLPYTGLDISTLIHQHIAQQPPLPQTVNPNIPPIISSIVMRLIAKDPLERYQTLSGVMADLMEYKQQAAGGVAPVRFELGRFDRTQTLTYPTRLIGRDKELEALKVLVKESLQAQGGLCFVSGEAGVGKSRLVDELREYTYSIGGIFVESKCYQYEFRAPYKVIAEAIEAYIDAAKSFSQGEREELQNRLKGAVGELGREAARITPKVADILGDLPALAMLDPEKEKMRFLITAAAFILHLSTRQKPLVIFLDDLQWADGGTIELLEKMAEEIKEYALVVVVSYRSEDLNSGHPLFQTLERLRIKNLPLVEIDLKALEFKDIAKMVSGLLLRDEKEVIPLARELDKTAKGNPFFVFELLRTLVAEGVIFWRGAGYDFDMRKLQSINIPENIVEIVLKRIKYIPKDDFVVMANASVIGRELLLDVLFNILPLPQEKILNSMESGIKNSLLTWEQVTGKFYFAHDRIREAFYRSLSADKKVLLHQNVAFYLEERNKAGFGEYLYEIARHFLQGGIEDKALAYSLMAADKAKATYAHAQAIELYETARKILEKQNRTNGEDYLNILQNLGEVYRLSGRFDEAISVFKKYDALIPEKDRLRKAQILYEMGSTYFNKGERDVAVQNLERSVEKLGYKIPQSAIGLYTGIFFELFIHILHRLLPVFFVRRTYKSHPVYSMLASYFKRLSTLYFHLDMRKTFFVAIKSFNIVDKLGPSIEYAQVCSLVGGTIGGIPLFKTALWYGYKGLEISRQIGNKLYEGTALSYLAFDHFVANKHRQAVSFGEECVEVLEGIGEYWELAVGYCWIVTGYSHTGKLRKSLEWGDRFIAAMRKADALQVLGWALGWTLRTRAFIGELDEKKLNELKECNELAWKTNDKANKVWSAVMVALGYLRLKDYERAVKYIKEAARLYPTHNNLVAWNSEIFPVGAQIYIDILKDNPSLSRKERDSYLTKAGRFAKQAMSKSLLHRTYRGWAYQVYGSYLWLKGRKKKARNEWRRGIKFLRDQTEDTYRLGSLLFESASFILKDNPQDKVGRWYLSESQTLFSDCGAQKDSETAAALSRNITLSGALESQEVLTLKRHIDFFLLVTQAIGSVYDSRELLDKIMDYALKVTGAQRGFVFLRDQKGDELRLEACRGIEVELHMGSTGYSSHGIIHGIIEEVEKNRTVLIVDAGETNENGRRLKNTGIKQVLCVPLKTKDRLLGVIYFDSRLAAGIFDKEKLELMRSFSVQAAISLENARFYSELEGRVKERTAELVSLNQVLGKEVGERKKAEESLREAYNRLQTMQEELIQAEKMSAIGQLAGGVAHEVRNPLAIILQSIDYIGTKISSGTDKDILEVLQIIRESIGRADNIIRILIDFSRVGKLNIVTEDVNAIVEGVFTLIKHQIKLNDIDIVKELDADIPQVLADKGKIEQALLNLFLNAVQAMPKGGKLTVRTRLVQPGRPEDGIAIEIEDTGVGIPEENIKKVFDPFFTTKGPRGGAGLGLAVTKHIIDMHQGLIKLKSSVGKGTCATIYLKAAENSR